MFDFNTDKIRQAKRQLAAALCLADYFGFNEAIYNHFSLMLPESEDFFLVNSLASHWSEVRASELLVANMNHEIVSGEVHPDITALKIHTPIHRSRPTARCILHTHMPYITALSCLENPELEPIHQSALKFTGRINYDRNFGGFVFDVEEGNRLAGLMQNHDILVLANHGVIVTGETVAKAFDDLYYLERAAQLQVLCYSTGRDPKRINSDVIASVKKQYEIYDRDNHAEKHFQSLLKVVASKYPHYNL